MKYENESSYEHAQRIIREKGLYGKKRPLTPRVKKHPVFHSYKQHILDWWARHKLMEKL